MHQLKNINSNIKVLQFLCCDYNKHVYGGNVSYIVSVIATSYNKGEIQDKPKKKVTVLEAAHNHVFDDRLFKFSGVVPDITRFCHITLFFMSDVCSKFRKVLKL